MSNKLRDKRGYGSQISECIRFDYCLHSDAVLLLWDPRGGLCTKGGTQKLRLVKLGSGEEAVGADEGEGEGEGGGHGGVQP